MINIASVLILSILLLYLFFTADPIPPLEITADMLFLLDSSSAVSKANYGKELSFLRKIIGQFEISARYVRAGIIPYGKTAELAVPLGSQTTNEAINRSISTLPYIGGNKRIDRALNLAYQTFSKARPLVPKILVIFTHGGQLTDPGTDLRLPVQALRGQGVSVFVIATGEGIDYSRLNQIAEGRNIIEDKSRETLQPYLSSAASYIRVNSGKDVNAVFVSDQPVVMGGSRGVYIRNIMSCIRLARAKFELTNQVSAGGNNFTVFTLMSVDRKGIAIRQGFSLEIALNIHERGFTIPKTMSHCKK